MKKHGMSAIGAVALLATLFVLPAWAEKKGDKDGKGKGDEKSALAEKTDNAKKAKTDTLKKGDAAKTKDKAELQGEVPNSSEGLAMGKEKDEGGLALGKEKDEGGLALGTKKSEIQAEETALSIPQEGQDDAGGKKGGPIVAEQRKHLKRLAKLDRLVALAEGKGKKKKDKDVISKIEELRTRENARHEKRMEQINAAAAAPENKGVNP